jgi:hypothetical protein
VFTTSNEGENSYSILSHEKTVYIKKNGNIMKRYYNCGVEKIIAKISSDDSSWKIWNGEQN